MDTLCFEPHTSMKIILGMCFGNTKYFNSKLKVKTCYIYIYREN